MNTLPSRRIAIGRRIVLISAKLIKKGRVRTRCESCRTKLEPGKSKIRLYGSGGTSDPPYVIYTCITCVRDWKEPKVQTVLKGAL